MLLLGYNTDTQNQIPRFFQSTPDGKEYQKLVFCCSSKMMLTTQAGLPGNDDSGAMGSFVAFSMLGLFPNPGQDVYLITPPFFEAVNITSPVTGKVARIRNVNFDPSYENIYIQRATLDGEAYRKNWIGHDFFTEGRELVLYLGRNETDWGRRDEDLPPSLSSYE
jgi:putative alpha-1,2-mannosidase